MVCQTMIPAVGFGEHVRPQPTRKVSDPRPGRSEWSWNGAFRMPPAAGGANGARNRRLENGSGGCVFDGGMKKAGGCLHRPAFFWSCRLRFLDLILHPITLPFDGDRFCVMQQAIQNG